MLSKLIFVVVATVVCAFPSVTAGHALVVGMAFGLSGYNPFPSLKEITPQLLGVCLVGLGANLGLDQVTEVGLSGIWYTIISIGCTFGVGLLLARLLKVDSTTSVLITTGTAICGGSAIAAISPLIQADTNRISIALATVFVLNAIALYLFPPLGTLLGLSGSQFGLWGALAIHDTSSVVGAAMAFGNGSLEIATTVKLARALWILPLAFIIYAIRRARHTGERGKISTYPLIYVIGFICVSALFTHVESIASLAEPIAFVARRGLVLVLFMIGAALSMEKLKSVGMRSLAFGAILWVLVGSALLGSVMSGWIS